MVSEELWRSFDTLYYQEKEPEAKSGIYLKYVELIINNKYRGVYALAEKMDRKLLKLKKEKKDVVKGELYDGYTWDSPVRFFGIASSTDSNSIVWGGWEVDYPDTTNWEKLYDFTRFAIQSSNAEFQADIFNKLVESNAINYYLFMNIIYAADNTGKNIYLAKYDVNEPYFFAPWDLDGTWGYAFNQNRTPYDKNLTNGLFTRLWDLNVNDYREKVANRWFLLRSTVFSKQSLFNAFEKQFNYLYLNGVYSREALLWKAGIYPDFSKKELDYMEEWTNQRLSFLDSYFDPFRSIPLPIEYQNFEATQKINGVVLSWIDATSSSIESFEIERSYDSNIYNQIGKISESNDFDTPNAYKFLDNNTQNGIRYYRLKIIKTGGSYSYSKVIKINYHGKKQIKIYPNPTNSNLHLEYSGSLPDIVSIYNVVGKLMLRATINSQLKTIYIGDFQKGVYFLRIGGYDVKFIKK